MSVTNPFVGLPVNMGARFIPQSLVAGAARSQSFYWPDPGWSIGNPGVNCISRDGVVRAAQQTVNGTASVIAGVSNQVAFAQMLSAALGDFVSFDFQSVLNLRLRTAVGSDGNYTSDDFNVYRAVCRMAYGGIAPLNDNLHDFGFQVGQAVGGSGYVLKDAVNGWHIQLIDGNIARLFIRGPNGLITQDLTAAPFDTSKFHEYEFRFLSATAVTPAQLYVLVDGIQIQLPAASRSWAAGTNNPPTTLTATRVGWFPRVVSFPGNANALFVSGVELMSGPTLDSVL